MELVIRSHSAHIRERIAEFRTRTGSYQPSQLDAEQDISREFSREAFADLIVEWIVSDDQVSTFFAHFSSIYLIF